MTSPLGRHSSEKIFSTLFELAHDAMLLLDESLHFFDCNDATLTLIGANDRRQVLHKTPADLSPEFQPRGERSAEMIRKHIDRAYVNGSTRFEWVHLRLDGTPADMDISLTSIPMGDKKILLALWRDITPQKKIERSQSAVYRISEAAQTAANLDVLLSSIHRIVSEHMPANNFYIAMVERESGRITFPYHSDESDTEWDPILPGKSITGYVLRTGRSLLATPEIFKELIEAGEVELLGSESVDWLGVPLKTPEGEIIGVMALQTYRPSVRLTGSDQEMLEFISQQVAVAVRRKQTEDAVRENEQSYAGLFNSVTEAIYIQDGNGRFVDVNTSVLTMYGYTREEIIGRTPEFLSAPGRNDLSRVIELVTRTFTTGEPQHFEFWGRRKNGECFPKDVTISKGRYFGKDVIIASARDTSERKRSEEELRRRDIRFAELLDSLREGVYKTTHDGRFVEVNDGLVSMLGYASKEELMAVDIAKGLYYDEQDRDRVVEEEIGGKDAVFRLKRKDGSTVWVEDQGRYIFDGDGNILFHEGILRDVTERKHAEDELRTASTVFESVSEAIVVTDPANTIIAVNPAFSRVTGYTKEDVIGKTPSLFQSGKHSRVFYQAMWNSINRTGTWQGEIINKRKNGELFVEWLSISTIYDAHGGVRQRVALFSDITQQKKMHAHLLQSQKLESLGTLAGGIAHDFNNLLAILLGSAELLKKRMTGDQRLMTYIDQIIDASHRGESISKQLLFFSRQSEVTLEPVSLTRIIEDVKTMLRHFIPKTITVSSDIDVHNGIIMGDAGHLHQILLNLCLNARDAIGTHGSITIRERNVDAADVRNAVSADVFGTYVAVEVTDTGSGIDPQILSKIYDPFFTTKEKGKGTGLGLSIVSGLMRSHNGFIDVRSTPGAGTTFTLYFPAAEDGTAVASSEEATFAFHGETILVVDDESSLRNALRELLEQTGCTVLMASDGYEALAVYEQHHADIAAIITDLGMPNMNGEEMYRQLKSTYPDVKVIISSGYLDGSIRSHLIENGIRDIVTKPYRFSEIAAVLSRVLYGKR